MAISEETTIDYFNWKKKKEPSYTDLLQNTADGIVTCNWYFILCCCFLYEMTYPLFLHGFLPGKMKGFPMEVLYYSR